MWVRLPPAAPVPFVLDFDCQAMPPDVTLCADRRDLGDAYVYLLGLYLGDGSLALVRNRVWKLRITLDRRYTGILDRCAWAVHEVSGHKAGRAGKIGCFDIYSTWKHWICLFPQHERGAKHAREIRLAPWQEQLVDAHPKDLLRGLIHSDGCRAINRVRRRWLDVTREYEYPRYLFSNPSAGIREIFLGACRAIGVDGRPNNWFSISVAKRASVQMLDSFIGPKR